MVGLKELNDGVLCADPFSKVVSKKDKRKEVRWILLLCLFFTLYGFGVLRDGGVGLSTCFGEPLIASCTGCMNIGLTESFWPAEGNTDQEGKGS